MSAPQETPAGSHAPYADVVETHSGVVVFLGDRAYKFKKPLDLGFLDYSTVEARRAACEEEVALNRRLAPEVYLGVADLRFDGRDEPAVVMRRLPPERRLANLLSQGADVEVCTRRLAHELAAFHSVAERTDVARRAASASSTLQRWEANAEELHTYSGQCFARGASSEVLQEAQRYLAGRQVLFEHRIAAGRAVDGHGDLLAQDIFCLEDGPAVLDCLEFDPALRSGDMLGDMAFLAMDLERLGSADLGWRLLEMHREFLDDDWPTSLAHHHIAYRAQVRAKVACIRIAQGGSSDEDPEKLLALAAGHLRAGRVDLIVVGGLPGSGKSTVASEVGDQLGAVVLNSDEVRKELAGIPSLVSASALPDEGIYDPAHTRLTYETLLVRAVRMLEMGESVVLDASFTDPVWREQARQLALDTSSRLTELHCVAPLAVLEQRVESRRAAGPSVSDACPEIVRTLASRVAAWPEATEIDTSAAVPETVTHAMAVVRGRPRTRPG